jgi:hypothetical protein
MAPRNETKETANGSEEPKAERGYATLATLRYVSRRAAILVEFDDGNVLTGVIE